MVRMPSRPSTLTSFGPILITGPSLWCARYSDVFSRLHFLAANIQRGLIWHVQCGAGIRDSAEKKTGWMMYLYISKTGSKPRAVTKIRPMFFSRDIDDGQA